jgi:hypothetical protein
MTQDNFDRVLRAFLALSPFRPFTLELVSGSRVEVNHPEALESRAGGLIMCKSTMGTRSVFEVASVIWFITATGTT